MRWVVVFLFFTSSLYSQTLIQTFSDRCTGEVKTVQIQMTGFTTVAFYNRTKTFTAQDFYSGALQKWMQDTYEWWYALSACSTAQTTQTTAQTNTSTATNTASNAASNASSESSNTTSTNTSTNNNDASSGNSSTDNSSTNNSESSSTNNENKETNEKSTEQETEQEAEQETKQEEQSDESDNESDSNDGEESEEEDNEVEKSEEKENKKENKKRNPISVNANVMAISGLDGVLNRAASFGFSQSSLNGKDTYSANLMIWDNLKQFSLSGSKSRVHFNYDREDYVKILGEDGKTWYTFGKIYEKGSIHVVRSTTVNAMYMFGICNISVGLSNVFLGQKDNYWKGFVGGYSISNNILFGRGEYTIMPSMIAFGTKPYSIKNYVISPMLALAVNPIYYSSVDRKLMYNEHVTAVVGVNFDFNLTKNFRANIGSNIVKSTDNFPLTYAITIGSKFQF